MLVVKNKLKGKLTQKQSLKGKLNNAKEKVYPSLINLEVTPSNERQVFNHDGEYGYDEVVVNKIEDDNLIDENIKDGTEILGVTGNYIGKKYAPRFISFYYYTGTELDEELANLDTSNVTNMSQMFANCKSVLELDLSSFDTSNVTNMSRMFASCNVITNIHGLENCDTSKVTDMTAMFISCFELEEIPDLDTSANTTMEQMFYQCGTITTIPLLNTSNVTSMRSCFIYCWELETIPLLDTSNVTNFYRTFAQTGIKTIPEIDTSNATTLSGTFDITSNLESLPLLDCSKVVNIYNVLGSSHLVLTTLGGFKNLGQAYLTTSSANYQNYTLNLSTCTALTHDSLMNVINNLYDIKTRGCNAQKLVLGTTNLSKLTEEEIAIATAKGWNVS